MLTETLKIKDQTELMKKNSFKVKEKVKYLGNTLTNMICMLFQNNYFKLQNKFKKTTLKWKKLPFFLLVRICGIKMNALLRTIFLFQPMPVLTN